MPNLLVTLQKQDDGYLHIVAELWGVDLPPNATAEDLAASLLDPELVAEILDSLPPEAITTLDALIARRGRLPWAEFIRRFGNIREMGIGKRDREKPHLNPVSPAEILYYRALLARAFFDTEQGPREFAYIPEDLLAILLTLKRPPETGGVISPNRSEPLGRPASPGERVHEILATDRILDDATTLLAALRSGHPISPEPKLLALLTAAGLIKDNLPQPEPLRQFLAASRQDALTMLYEAWQNSETFNELRLIPGLICEGEWSNQPLITREFLLNLLADLLAGKWWSLSAFVRAIKEKYPDFQRPAGDYDSWFIKRASDGQYLRGFAHWDEVDGLLIRFFITDILHWLGMADLALPENGETPAAFRLVASPFQSAQPEDARLFVSSLGKITIPRFAPRSVRYQIARFCEWDEEKADEYHFHLTPQSLARARQQGLTVEHLLTLLARYADAGIPPALVKALKRWQVNGTEARVQNPVILRVSRPEVLEEMRKSKAGRFLGEMLSPTVVIVKEGAQAKVIEALLELGLLAEDETKLL